MPQLERINLKQLNTQKNNMKENKDQKEQDKEVKELEELEALGGITNPNEERDSAVKDSLINGIKLFKGLKLRPVTLSTLAILEKLKSPLVTGEEGDNVIEALIFLWIQSEEISKVRAATLTSTLDSRISIENRALELGDKIEISDMNEIIDLVTDMMNESQQTKVQQVPNEDTEEATKKSKNE